MSGGPYLTMAVTCERVLEEKDGVQSAIRIVDRFTSGQPNPENPDQMPPLVIDLTALVIVKAGEARGRFALRLRPERPSGQQMDAAEFAIRFDAGPDQGQALTLPIQMEVDEEGLWWIDVLFVAQGEETLMSRMPLTIRWQPQPRPASQP